MNWKLLSNSLLISLGTTVGSIAIGSIAAAWMSALGKKARSIILVAGAMSLALPSFLVTNCWLEVVGETGAWKRWLPFSIYSHGGTIWILTLLLWPVSFLFVSGALQKLQPSQLEVDPALCGWKMVRWLLLPAAWPGIKQGALLTFILAWNNFAVPAILQSKVFPAEIWVSFNTTFDYLSTIKLSTPLFLISLALLVWLGRDAISWPRLQGSIDKTLFRRQLGMPNFLASAVIGLGAVFFSLVVPFSALFLTRRTWLELPDALAAGRTATINSAVFATTAASLALFFGFALRRYRWLGGLWILFLLPGVLLGIALIYIFNRNPLVPFYQSPAIVVLALFLRYWALSWSGTQAMVTSVDRRLAEVAQLQGASLWQSFRYVWWPQVRSQAAGLWLITYLLCLWDVETLVLIIPPGCETLSLRVFNLLHYGHNTQVNALCAILLGLAILPFAVWGMVEAPFWKRFSRFSLSSTTLLFLCLGVGCSREALNEAPIQSRFFSKVKIVSTRGTALGQFNKPRSLTLDRQDNLYVVDMTGRVQKFSSNGVYLSSWQMPEIEKGRPKGMCLDSSGEIVVVEPHYNRVNHFTTEGRLTAQWGVAGTNSGQLCLPRAITLGPGGDLFLCEYTQVDRVQRFSAHGKPWKLTFGQTGKGNGELNRPEGLAFGHNNEVFVADSCNHRIAVFTSEGKFIRNYGHAGSGPGELSYPYDIQLDQQGYQFVAEFGNSRIQVFDAAGKSVEVIGKAGAAPGQFSNPWSLAFDSVGNLYVADSQNHRVQKFIRK